MDDTIRGDYDEGLEIKWMIAWNDIPPKAKSFILLLVQNNHLMICRHGNVGYKKNENNFFQFDELLKII